LKSEALLTSGKEWNVINPWTKQNSQLALTESKLVFIKKNKASSSEAGLDISLNHIAKALSETTNHGETILKLILNDGKHISIPFNYVKSMRLLGFPLLCTEQRMEVARWVYAINNRLRRR